MIDQLRVEKGYEAALGAALGDDRRMLQDTLRSRAWQRGESDALRRVIDRTTGANATVGAPTTWVLSNHDVYRHLTRYGGGAIGGIVLAQIIQRMTGVAVAPDAAAAATGVVLSAIYMLTLVQRVFWNPLVHEENKKLTDMRPSGRRTSTCSARRNWPPAIVRPTTCLVCVKR